MKIAAVVFTYRESPEMVIDCLNSLYSQIDCENIDSVMLYSSNKKNIEIEIQRTFKGKKPPLNIIHKKSLGKRVALNNAVRILRERCDFIIFVDCDVVIGRGSLKRLTECIKVKENYGICSAVPTVKKRSGFLGNCFLVTHKIYNYYMSRRLKQGKEVNEFYDGLYIIRTSVSEELPEGCINESEFLFRATRDKGYKVMRIEDAKAFIEPVLTFSDFIRFRKRLRLGTRASKKLFGSGLESASVKELFAYTAGHLNEIFQIIALIFIEIVTRTLIYFDSNQPELWEPTMSAKMAIHERSISKSR